MGNSPSKNEPLPKTSQTNSSIPISSSEVDSDELAPALSHPSSRLNSTANAITISKCINNCNNLNSIKKRKRSKKDLNLDLEIGASMAQLLKNNHNQNLSSSVETVSSGSSPLSNVQDEFYSSYSLYNSIQSKFMFKESISEETKMDSIAENCEVRDLLSGELEETKKNCQVRDLLSGVNDLSIANDLSIENDTIDGVNDIDLKDGINDIVVNMEFDEKFQSDSIPTVLIDSPPQKSFKSSGRLIERAAKAYLLENPSKSLSSSPDPKSINSTKISTSPDLKFIDKSEIKKVSSSSSESDSSPCLLPIKKNDIDIDSIINKLIHIGTKKPPSQSQMRRGKDKLPLTNQDLKYILGKSRQIFMDQPTLLNLSPSVKIVGDIHGQFNDLIRIFNTCGYPPYTNYLFLGDYVDRGYKSLETILLLFCYKIKYPENFFMLRGNHESANITKIYGFYDECKRRLSSIGNSHKLWKNFVDVFNTLPIAATINNKILCIHGGLSPDLHDLKQIEQIKRPSDIPDKGLLADLLWSDPDPSIKNFSVTNWPKNDRGVSYCFGKKHVDYFCNKFKLDLIVRGHMVVEDGYEFFNKRKLVTIFSAPNYCGEFDNFGAVMSVDKNLYCSFDMIKPNGK